MKVKILMSMKVINNYYILYIIRFDNRTVITDLLSKLIIFNKIIIN